MNSLTFPSIASPAAPAASRFPYRSTVQNRRRVDNTAAYLVLATRHDEVKALLFNADHRYLTEVIDDPLTVDILCGTGRRCDPPEQVAIDPALGGAVDREILCFALSSR